MLALADRGFQQTQTLAVERGDGRIVHLVVRDFQHLVLQIDGIAGRAGLEMFSASTRWRSWCHCILVRNADRIGRSFMAIAVAPLTSWTPLGPPEVGRICPVYG